MACGSLVVFAIESKGREFFGHQLFYREDDWLCRFRVWTNSTIEWKCLHHNEGILKEFSVMKRHIIVCTFQMSPEKSQKSLQQHSLQNQQNNSQHQIGDRSRKNQQQRPQSSNTYSRGGRGGFERGGPRGGRGAPADKHAYYGKLTKMCDLGICTMFYC